MNEVRPTQVTQAVSTTITPVASAASYESVDDSKTLTASGKNFSVKTEKNVSNVLYIEQAVMEINKHIQSVQRDLHFSVDEESGLTVIRVRDKESGDLIRQIPEDVFLNLAQNLIENQTIHLFDAHG